MSKPLYRDINTFFGADSNVILLEDDRAILNSFINLFSTLRGDRPFKYYLGCDIISLLFQPVCALTASYIKDEMMYAAQYEPRGKVVEDETAVVESQDDSAYYISLVIVNMATGSKSTVPLVFKRS
jgi:phage baseplate assembly protein W